MEYDYELENLTFEVLFHKYLYFQYDISMVSDEVYDDLRSRLRLRLYLKDLDTPHHYPGYHFPEGHSMARNVAGTVKDYMGFNV